MENVIEHIIASSIWKPTSVEQTPHVIMQSWQVYEVVVEGSEEPSRHFVGWNASEHEGRVSSMIVEWDSERMLGKTQSGRVYKLEGKPAYDSDAHYVFSYWKQACGVKSCKNVTDEIFYKFTCQ